MRRLPILLSIVSLFVIAQMVVSAELPGALKWPEPSMQSRPWTRWWWHGSAVDEKTLTQLLEEYHRAGIGGVEICPIYGAKGFEQRYVPYLSPRWMQLLAHVTTEAERLGIGVDLTDGTGWPFGGPSVSPNEASTRIVLKTFDSVADALKGQSPGSIQCLMMRSDAGRWIDLAVQSLQRPPAEKSPIYAANLVSPIQKVKRAAPGGEGNVLDPYSVAAIDHYLAGFDRAFADFAAPRPRAHFHDSFEYYDANWTRGFFDQFQSRRGYDLRQHLPELMDEGDRDIVARVKCDYRETISDLHLAYVSRWNEWCHRQGGLSRNQAHGAPANLLDVYAAADIPETETFGQIDPRWFVMHKLASSAAHITGRNLASCESFTWLGEHFHVSLADAKRAADYIFLTGANHIFFHGIAYSPPDVPWPGWLFYASVNFAPQAGVWRDLPEFNQYITRCQSILQSGRSDNDLLLYFPAHDLWQNADGLLVQWGMHKQEQWLWPQPFYAAGKLLNDSGYTFDATSDRLLERAQVKEGKIEIGGGKYAAIVLPGCRLMPPKTLTKLVDLARNGARIVATEDLPRDVPGFGDLEARRAEFQRELSKLRAMADKRVCVGDDLVKLLEQLKVRRESMVAEGLSFVRRARPDGFDYFVVNRSTRDLDGWVTLATAGHSAALMDALTGHIGVADTRHADGAMQVHLQFKTGQSCIVRTFNVGGLAGEKWVYFEPLDKPVELKGIWRVRFIEGGPDLPGEFETCNLSSWTAQADDRVRSFVGTARYTLEFEAPGEPADEIVLDLGKVCESARVTINDQQVATLFCAPYEVSVSRFLKSGRNKLQVEVTNLAANRIADLDRRGVNWKNFHEVNLVNQQYKRFDASSWSLRDSGLLGPVRLIRMKR